MNNPVRSAIQRHVEARRMILLGGAMRGGRALEIGCGRGVGAELILETFGADSVDAFDLDPRMIRLARRRLQKFGSRVRLWVGDAGAISTTDSIYDAVFDFGIIHHVQEWRRSVAEVHRVLRPGGKFYAEEVLRSAIVHPIARSFLEHPQEDRFDAADFRAELENSGFVLEGTSNLRGAIAWFAAHKPAF